MTDKTAVLLALRNRALAFAGPTTGSVTLARTTTGYTRSTGSFVTDGFKDGMELTESGFPTNSYSTVKEVSALSLTVHQALSAATAASGRTLAVGLPAVRGWENEKVTPVSLRPYLEESFIPTTSEMWTMPYNGGRHREEGLYLLKWYGLDKSGTAGIRKCVDDLMGSFTPGTALTAGSDTVLIRGDIGPTTSQLVPQGNGWSVCVLTIGWRVETTNTVAA